MSDVFFSFLKGGALILFPLSSALAVDGNWISTATATQLWGSAANWSSNPLVPGGAGSHIRIESDIALSTTIDLESNDRTVGILEIGDAVGTRSFTIAGSGGGDLILEREGGAQINMNQGGNNVIEAAVVLNSDLTINNDLTALTDQTLSITSSISGSGSMTVNGPGRVYLSADNSSYTGDVFINNAEVSFFLANATQRSLGSGTISLNGATLSNPGGGKTFTNDFNWGGSLIFKGGSSLTFTGAVDLAADTTINSLNNTQISGPVTGDHDLIINAAADKYVLLRGSNSFTGYVDVQGGALGLQGGSAILDTGELRVSGGSVNLINSETIGDLTMSSGSLTSASAGLSLTASAFNFTNSGTVSIQLAGGAAVLTKTGAGIVSLDRVSGSSYGGGTVINAGILAVSNTSGSATGSGSVSVASGAGLTGSGIIAGSLDVSGSLAPGNEGLGTLTVANSVTWNGSDAWVFELGASAGSLTLAAAGESVQDQLLISGANGDFLRGTGSAWTFDFSGGGAEGWYELVTWSGLTSFDPGNFKAVNLANGLVGTFAFDDSTSGLYLNVIPEPSSFALAASAVGIAALLRRRSRSANPLG